MPRAGSRSSSTGPTLAIQGPPGSGKTYTGARMICRALAAGEGVGITANSHKVIGNLLQARSADAAGVERRRPAPSSAATPSRSSSDDRVTAARTPPTSRAQLADGRRTSPPGTAWLWSRPRWPTPSTCCSSTRPARCRSPTSSPIARAAREPRAARRPAAARPAAQGHPPARRRAFGARAPARRARDDAAGPRPVPRDDLAPAPGALRRFTSEVFYDGRLEPEAHLVRPAADRRRTGSTARPALRRRPERRGATTNRRSRPKRSPRSPTRSWRRRDWIDQRRRRARSRLGRRPDRRAYNAQVAAIKRLLPAEARGRHGRQVPGPGGPDRRLLDDDLERRSSRRAAWSSSTASTGSTSRRRGPAAWR